MIGKVNVLVRTDKASTPPPSPAAPAGPRVLNAGAQREQRQKNHEGARREPGRRSRAA